MLKNDSFLDFVYIGAPRSGSTWLAAALNEHPDIWLPHNKELHFFNDRSLYSFEYKYPRGIGFYRKYFLEADASMVLGELSPLYYIDPNCAYRIHKHFPDVKIIALLRNPAEVVFSLYLKRSQLEKRERNFIDELRKNPGFLDLGYYGTWLARFFDWFDKKQIHIRIFEEFFSNQKEEIEQIFRFLGVDSSFIPSVLNKRVNVSEPRKPMLLSTLNGWMLKALNTKPFIPVKEIMHKLKINRHSFAESPVDFGEKKVPRLDEKTYAELMERFEPDIVRLEKLTGRNLDIWRKKH